MPMPKKEILSGVYVITSIKTGKFYHGSSHNLRKRKTQHLSNLKHKRHQSTDLQRLYDKHGRDDLRFTVVKLIDDREEAYAHEDRLIKRHAKNPKSLNVGLGARGGDNLTRNTRKPEIIAQITKTLRKTIAKMSSAERKALHSQPGKLNGMWGQTHTPETRAKISAARMGIATTVGYTHTDATRERLSEHAKQRTGERNSFFGKTHSAETRAILSAASKGKLPGNTRRVKIGKKTYVSATEAGRQFGVVTATILHRIKSPNYPEYSYKD